MDQIGRLVAKVAENAASRGSQFNAPALPASTANPPAYFDRRCDCELRGLVSWIPDQGPREIVRDLTGEERAALSERAAALKLSLQPYLQSERNEVEANIAAMFGGFRSMRHQGDDAEGIVAATASVLRNFPLWAIAKACLKIARNEAGLDRRFAPNDTEVFSVVDGIVRDYRNALVNAEALLSARVRTATALPSPLPITEADIENRLALLGRPLSTGTALEKRASDGKHAERVAADLERRRKPEAAA